MSLTRSRTETRQALVTLALLALTLGATFFPVLFEGKSLLPSDLINTMTLPFSESYQAPHAYNSLVTDGYFQFYPLKYLTSQAFESGRFAFWNPFILNGYPQYVEGMWTYNPILLLPLSFALCLNLLLIVPLLVAGFGMYLLLRDYAVRVGIARIFATAYMLNALFLTHLLAHFIPAAFSFAPWILFFLHRYHTNARLPSIALASITLGLGILAGNVQTAAFLFYIAACYWLALKWSSERRLNVRPLALALLIGIGIGMVYLLPASEMLHEVTNGGVSFSTSFQRGYSFASRLLSIPLVLTFFMPQLAGSIRGITLPASIGVFPIDFQGAIGFATLLLALWGSVRLWKSKPEIRPFVLLGVTGLLLPIATPLFHVLYHRFFVVFVLGACCTGAIAFEEILQNDKWKHSVVRWLAWASVLLGVLIVLLSVSSCILYFEHERVLSMARECLLPRFAQAAFASGNESWIASRIREAVEYWSILRPEWIAAIASSMVAVGVVYLGISKRILSYPRILAVLWVITTFQLVLFARSWLPATDTQRFPLYPSTSETRLLQSLSVNSRVCFFRQIAPGKQTMFIDNENIIYGIREATGYESLTPRCLFNAIGVTPDAATQRLLSRFNVGTICTALPIADTTQLTTLVRGPIWIYRLNSPTPRAFLTCSTATLPNDRLVLDSLRYSLSPWPAALFTGDQKPVAMSATIDQHDSVSLLEDSGSRIVFRTHSDQSEYFVLTDTYYPGWICTVDGVETETQRCNYAMRAVLLHPGYHTVEYRFEPKSFRLGLWLSIVSACLLALVIPYDFFRRRLAK